MTEGPQPGPTDPGPTGQGASAPGIADLLGRILGDAGRLLQAEFSLAKAEVRAAVRMAAIGLAALAAAVVLAIIALARLVGAVEHGLIAAGLPPPWAALTVAVVAVILAFGALRLGLYLLSRALRGPERTLRNLRRDVETLGTMVERDA